MRRRHMLVAAGVILLGSAALALSGLVPNPALAQAEPIQVQESNIGGIMAELTEAKRKGDVLTIKLRFRNTSGASMDFQPIAGRNYDMYYVTAEDKKYLVLRDSEDVPLASPADGSGTIYATLAKDATFTLWAKYPAPPAAITSIIFYTPLTAPFEDIPISE